METEQAVAALAALAQPTRLEVFRLLVQRGPEGLAPGGIAQRLGLPAPTLSFHLAQLAQAGLVLSRRQGRSILYAADYAAMARLMEFLSENCCAGACTPEGPRVGRGRKRGARPEAGRERART